MANRDEQSNAAYDNWTKRFNDCNCNNVPSANITESEKFYRIEMALPGVDKNRIEIKHENQQLTVSVNNEDHSEQNQYQHREYDYRAASRTFKTGNKIDADHITAQYENGILTLILPKKEEFVKRPAQTIEVK
jgi:HSP20 family protein